MRIETATAAGDPDRPNEDFTGVICPGSGRGGVLAVLDGVTPHPDGTGCTHGLPWYVARLGGVLLELSASRRDMTLSQCLAQAIGRTAAAHRDTCDLSHPNTPQSTVVAVRWDDEAAEHLVLSDSVLLLESPSGAVRPVLDDRLDRLPEPVPSLRARLRALPRDSGQRAAARREYTAAVEALRNAEDGFLTAAADPGVADHAVTGCDPRAAVRAVAALSDGAGRLVDVFGRTDWPGAFALLRTAGCDGLIAAVRAAEHADPDGTAHPRGKRHDDATAALAEL
ncbi:hypothetical protein POF50_030790 [Streptomyces sp. SL13]|uniref:Protein phosphatase 2C domain-containing protein n=1 Tax=Streptantibioticus silvisoli TaxID=2705255 RepID=A0AA90KBR4_9ACTN|nr:hypothetical protein [Streptantibioticus silvisoli]MDI5973677.1 hypothetical protein [Streptantibioticus silvisoli]